MTNKNDIEIHNYLVIKCISFMLLLFDSPSWNKINYFEVGFIIINMFLLTRLNFYLSEDVSIY